MRTPASICVNDDLTACEASIALRATNDELARWVDVQVRVITVKRQSRLAVLEDDFAQGPPDDLLFNELVHLLHAWCSGIWAGVARNLLFAGSLQWLSMLRR